MSLQNRKFRGNSEIKLFNELKLFTNISILNNQVFAGAAIEEITLPPKITSLYRTFDNCSNLKKVKGLEHITELEDRVFTNCKDWTEILNMPALNNVINYREMFQGSGLKGVENLGSITILPSFQNSQIEYINIPDTVTEISANSLRGCQKLEKVVIPKNVKLINNGALIITPKNPPIIFLGEVPPTCTETESISSGRSYIYVPDGSLNAYRSAPIFSKYASKILPISEFVE